MPIRQRTKNASETNVIVKDLPPHALTFTEAAKANAGEFIDTRFVKELEDSGFIKSLYGE